jgi:hypothetical protein
MNGAEWQGRGVHGPTHRYQVSRRIVEEAGPLPGACAWNGGPKEEDRLCQDHATMDEINKIDRKTLIL